MLSCALAKAGAADGSASFRFSVSDSGPAALARLIASARVVQSRPGTFLASSVVLRSLSDMQMCGYSRVLAAVTAIPATRNVRPFSVT